MRLNNVTQIKSEDYDSDIQQTIDQLAETLNPFMQEVVELSNDRIDFENRVENLRTIQITLDDDGVPILNNRVSVGKTGIRGIQVINAFNLTNATIRPTAQPWVNFTALGGENIRIENITGLPANNRFQLTLVIY